MKIDNINNLAYMEFPTGRRTRVMIGQNGKFKGDYFCQGFVEIFEGGSIPAHNHETIETYTVLQGTGELIVGDERTVMKAGDFVLIDSNKEHSLRNTGKGNLYMMFVYAPQIIVDHWAKELGEKK